MVPRTNVTRGGGVFCIHRVFYIHLQSRLHGFGLPTLPQRLLLVLLPRLLVLPLNLFLFVHVSIVFHAVIGSGGFSVLPEVKNVQYFQTFFIGMYTSLSQPSLRPSLPRRSELRAGPPGCSGLRAQLLSATAVALINMLILGSSGSRLVPGTGWLRLVSREPQLSPAPEWLLSS